MNTRLGEEEQDDDGSMNRSEAAMVRFHCRAVPLLELGEPEVSVQSCWLFPTNSSGPNKSFQA